jgi:putative hydrolases of HD superfamily
MALVHDMAEAVVGDMTPECGILPGDKHKIEIMAMQEICRLLNKETGNHINELFEEYNAGTTEEAMMVKQIDKLEFMLQTAEYEKAKGINLEEFFRNTRHLLKDRMLIELMQRIDEERSK